MDTDWCRKRIYKYLEALEENRKPRRDSRETHNETIRLEQTIIPIFDRLDPSGNSLIIDKTDHYNLERRAHRALGILEDYDVLHEKLGPDQPVIAADRLHPWIWGAARQLWPIKHYREALLAAAKMLNAQVQTKVNRRDVSDDKLVQECFSDSPPQTGKPRLRFPGYSADQTVKSFQRGTFQLALGCVAAIRNPAAHLAEHDAGELDEQVAFEQLATLSTVARLLDQCEVITIDEGTAETS